LLSLLLLLWLRLWLWLLLLLWLLIVGIGIIRWASLVVAVTAVVARLARSCSGWVTVPSERKGD